MQDTKSTNNLRMNKKPVVLWVLFEIGHNKDETEIDFSGQVESFPISPPMDRHSLLGIEFTVMWLSSTYFGRIVCQRLWGLSGGMAQCAVKFLGEWGNCSNNRLKVVNIYVLHYINAFEWNGRVFRIKMVKVKPELWFCRREINSTLFDGIIITVFRCTFSSDFWRPFALHTFLFFKTDLFNSKSLCSCLHLNIPTITSISDTRFPFEGFLLWS